MKFLYFLLFTFFFLFIIKNSNAQNIGFGHNGDDYRNRGTNGAYLGYDAARSVEWGESSDQNSYFGYKSGGRNGGNNRDESYNTFVGAYSGYNINGGDYNVIIGKDAGRNIATGNNNLYLGSYAGLNNADGSENIFIGFHAGENANGSNQLYIANSSQNNLIYGRFDQGRLGVSTQSLLETLNIGGALKLGNTGSNNSGTIRWTGQDFEGYNGNAWLSLTAFNPTNQGEGNLFLGQGTGSTNDGQFNTFIGANAGLSNTEGANNTFIGYDAGKLNSTGRNNFFAGVNSGENNTEGSDNTFIGLAAGLLNGTGSNNTFLGRSAGGNHRDGNGNVFIGYEAGYNEQGSNRLHITNNQNNTLIYGQFDQNRVGIATTSPGNTLDVAGGIDINDYIRHNGDENTYIGFRANNEIILTTAGRDAITVKNDQKVGIGKLAPVYKLDVAGAISTNDYIYHNGDGNTYIGFPESDEINMVTSGGSRLRIKANGYVGIGDSSPLENLEVAGAIKLGNTGNNNSGTIRWTGQDFQGRLNGSWVSLTNDSDEQNLSIDGSSLSISNGNTVDLAGLRDGDQQTLEFNDNNELSISNGNIVDLSSLLDGVEDADSDPNNELISQIELNEELQLSITEGENTSNVDLSPIRDSFQTGWEISENNVLFTEEGNIGIGTNDPTSKLDINGGDVFFNGQVIRDENEITGVYAKWFYSKGAFRAGGSNGSPWRDENVGLFSFAVGRGTKAKGEYSSAFGALNNALGDYSSSFGRENTITRSGTYSVAFGFDNTISNTYATVFGRRNIVAGRNAVAFGDNTVAETYASITIGRFNQIQANDLDENRPYSPNSWEEEDYLLVAGNGTDENNRNNALTLYKNGNLEMNGAYPFDNPNGEIELLPNQFSWNSSRGYVRLNALASSEEEQPGFGSIAAGRQTTSEGWFSAAFGDNVSSENRASFVIGAYNELDEEGNPGNDQLDDYIFAIGNGSEGRRANAMTVLRNGNTDINGNVTVENLINNSDRRYKKNINKLKSISKLGKLNGVQYNLKKSKDDRLEFGFIAQEIQKVYPNLVYEDKKGYLGVNYIGLIPLLTEAYKELKKELKDKDDKITLLEKKVEDLNSRRDQNLISQKAQLFQNKPNPFTENTIIEFELLQNTQKAELYIYDMSGKQLKTFVIDQRGKGSVEINGRELKAGMYLYSLIADGEEIGTERMILTRQ